MFVFPTVEKVLDKKSKDEFVKFGRTCVYSKKQLLLIRCAYLCTIACCAVGTLHKCGHIAGDNVE